MNPSDATANSENTNRFHRFVTFPQENSENITTISDEDFFQSLEGLYSLAYWGPLYCKQRREEFEGYLHNENLIKSTGDSWLRTRLKLAKYLSDFVSIEVEKSLRLMQVTLERDIEKHFDFDEAKDLCEKMPVESWRDHALEKSILKKRYPLLSLYTSQKGFRLWFNRNRSISAYSNDSQRAMQYCERNEDHIGNLVEEIGKLCKGNGQTLDQLKLSFVSQYRIFYLKFIYIWIRHEYRNLSLNQPNLNFYGHVYRGEVMKEKEFQNLLQKVKSTSESRLLGCSLISASQERKSAERFQKPHVQNTVRVLHKVWIPPPMKKSIDEFQRAFPQEHLVNNVVSIQKLSEFGGEKEVLLLTLQTYITDIYQDKDGIWHIESVSCDTENTIAMECASPDKFEQYKSVPHDLGALYDFLAQHPDLLAWQFNKHRCYAQGAGFASLLPHKSDKYHCSEETFDNLIQPYAYFKVKLGLP